MFKNEFENFPEDTGLVELVEQFERYLTAKERHYFDEEALERILEYYELHNDEIKMEAVADYAIRQNPYSSDFIIRKAELLLNKKKYKEALEWLDKASLLDAHEIDIYLIRSDIFIETNEIDKAVDTLQEALEVADEDEKDVVYAEMSDVYEIKEEYETAFNCLVNALKHNAQNEEALNKMAHIVDMTEKYEESITIHKNITEKDPYNWLAWYNLGRGYTGVELYERALEAFEFVMAVNEDFDWVYRDAAEVYYRQEDFIKAIQMYENANEKAGGFEDYSFRIGLCYERMEDYKSARFNYRKATRQDPYLDEAFFRIGETYRLQERYEPALVNYKKALKLDEENEYYVTTLISLYRLLSRDEEILFYLGWLIQIRPDILNYWLDYILFLYDCTLYADALDATHDAIQRCGNFAEFYYLQSAVLWKLGRQKESIHFLEQALDDDFNRHVVLYDTDVSFYQHPKIIELIERFRK